MKIPGPETGYTDLLDYATQLKIQERAEQRGSFPLRPSAAGDCSRKLAYDLMEYRGYAKYEKEVMKPQVHRLLNLGHYIESALIKDFYMLSDVGMQIRYKQQAVTLFQLDPILKKEQEIIEGQVDLVIWSDKYKCVMDVKSAKDKFSKAFQTGWIETLDKLSNCESVLTLSETAFYIEDLPAFIEEYGDPFLADNLWQLNAYCCSDFFRERGIDHGTILKYNKNDSRLYEIRFKPSIEMMEQLRNKFNKVNKAVAKKKPEMVEKDFTLGSIKCSFCPYADRCWGKDTKKEFFKTLPPKKWPKDTHKMTQGQELETLFQKFKANENLDKDRAKVEEKIIKLMLKEKVNKIRLSDDTIYELKHLKSPRPHFEVRRSKL